MAFASALFVSILLFAANSLPSVTAIEPAFEPTSSDVFLFECCVALTIPQGRGDCTSSFCKKNKAVVETLSNPVNTKLSPAEQQNLKSLEGGNSEILQVIMN